MSTAAAPPQLSTTLVKPELVAVLLAMFQSNAFLQRELVQNGKFEFLMHCARTDTMGLGHLAYVHIWDELVRTCPPPLSELPDGTVLNEYGHIVPPTQADLRAARNLVTRTSRVILSGA